MIRKRAIFVGSLDWRLLETGRQDGATNMAVDEAILLAVAQAKVPPTLRLYGWEPACLSIGYFQSAVNEVDLDACRELGVDLVRRPTGGRAILHEHEITYSVVVSQDDPLIGGGIGASYEMISKCLVAGLALLGSQAVPAPSRRQAATDRSIGQRRTESSGRSPACFDAPSDYEILFCGRKLVGSAQMRRLGTILQHGSILLDADVAKMAALLKAADDTARERFSAVLTARMASLRKALGRQVGMYEAARALKAGFEAVLGVRIEPGVLTRDEVDAAERLRREKYCAPDWNLRR
ncbi:MAG: lipoate--protein ligase family protein [Chloroflexi bacterium]|nr:lipoate--protein ligase family protein [Chloroflexota bacterium]